MQELVNLKGGNKMKSQEFNARVKAVFSIYEVSGFDSVVSNADENSKARGIFYNTITMICHNSGAGAGTGFAIENFLKGQAA
jgi:hypothetical protein